MRNFERNIDPKEAMDIGNSAERWTQEFDKYYPILVDLFKVDWPKENKKYRHYYSLRIEIGAYKYDVYLDTTGLNTGRYFGITRPGEMKKGWGLKIKDPDDKWTPWILNGVSTNTLIDHLKDISLDSLDNSIATYSKWLKEAKASKKKLLKWSNDEL